MHIGLLEHCVSSHHNEKTWKYPNSVSSLTKGKGRRPVAVWPFSKELISGLEYTECLKLAIKCTCSLLSSVAMISPVSLKPRLCDLRQSIKFSTHEVTCKSLDSVLYLSLSMVAATVGD